MPTVAGQHRADNQPGECYSRHQVDFKMMAKNLFIKVCKTPTLHDPSVTDKNIDMPKMISSSGDKRFQLTAVGHICGDDKCFTSRVESPTISSDSLQIRDSAGGQDNMCTA